jgi:hypothetical protein
MGVVNEGRELGKNKSIASLKEVAAVKKPARI